MTENWNITAFFARLYRTKASPKRHRISFFPSRAVSQAVRQLEEQLGTQLLLRSSKKVELTAEGKLLYEYASSALGLLESAEHQLGGLHELKVGQLRLAAGDITARASASPRTGTFSPDLSTGASEYL